MLLTLLVISILVNLAAALAVVQVIRGRGGFQYLKSYLKDGEVDANAETGETARAHLLSLLPAPDVRPVVFLGDSLTAGCEWQELFGPSLRILNRGIGGDTSPGVLNRISAVSKLEPIAVFLMIGANDAQAAKSAKTAEVIRKIVDHLRQHSPDCQIFIQSILPSRTPKFNRWGEQVNSKIREFADDEQVRFVDLRPFFTDTEGLLGKKFTYDGLHLSGKAYFLWKQHLDPIITELAAKSSERSAGISSDCRL